MAKVAVSWHDEKVIVPGIGVKWYESEAALQIYSMTWLRKCGIDRGWHHSGNERAGSGMRMKLMGQSKGFPDLICIGKKLAVEFKFKRRILSKEQRAWREYFLQCGWQFFEVRRFPKFEKIILREFERELVRNGRKTP